MLEVGVNIADIVTPPSLYPLFTPLRSPLNLIIPNPIVSLAIEVPIPDRW